MYRITGGFKGGELVIVAGLSSISEGMKVRLLANDQPEAAKERLAKGDVGAPFVDGPDGVKKGAEQAPPEAKTGGDQAPEKKPEGETPEAPAAK